MKKEWENSSIVKALLNGGFDEEYIEKAIANGDIVLEKSKTEKEMEDSKKKEEKNIVDDEKHIEDLEDDEEEDEEDVEDLEDDEEEKDLEKCGCKGDEVEKCDSLKKGFDTDFLKSFGNELKEAFKEALEEQIAPLRKSIETIGQQPQPFKSEGLDRASFIEKSFENMKDDRGKLTVNIATQRPLARKLIEKAIENDSLEKSIGDDAIAYLTNPEAETVGEDLARYMYEKQNVKFVR